jgi:hypothetical protein
MERAALACARGRRRGHAPCGVQAHLGARSRTQLASAECGKLRHVLAPLWRSRLWSRYRRTGLPLITLLSSARSDNCRGRVRKVELDGDGCSTGVGSKYPNLPSHRRLHFSHRQRFGLSSAPLSRMLSRSVVESSRSWVAAARGGDPAVPQHRLQHTTPSSMQHTVSVPARARSLCASGPLSGSS